MENPEASKQNKKHRSLLRKCKAKLKKKYKAFISRTKRYKGVSSIVISVRGVLYETSLQNEDVAEYINYKFGAICSRVRRDIRDIDPTDEVLTIRIGTLFYEAIIGVGGRADKEFMIFVTQKTPETIPRPIKKPKVTDVYRKETDPFKVRAKRKNPVADLQKEIFGITAQAATQQKQIKHELETRAVKMAEEEYRRKYKIRLKNLTTLTEKAIDKVTPPRTHLSKAGQWRKVVEKRKLEEKKKAAAPPVKLQLGKMPNVQQTEDYGYFKRRTTRRISLYDDDGYKTRGDVLIGFRPEQDPNAFFPKKVEKRVEKSQGVFRLNKEDDEDGQSQATKTDTATTSEHHFTTDI